MVTSPRHMFFSLMLFGTLGLIACDGDEGNNDTTNNGTTNNGTTNNGTSNNGTTIDKVAMREAWEKCVDETTTYTPFETSISTAARVSAFERIADELWRNDMIMGSNFEMANLIYLEEEGLDSRLSRREDEHYPAAMEGGMTVACNTSDAVATANPDRCVGPAQMKPILIDAFTKGAMSTDAAEMELEARRVEATLLWFFYTSVYKEAVTCTAKKKDCDSSYAYYTGDEPRTMGLGLAKYFRDEAPAAHEATWDGILKVRCWREVDSADTAQNLELRDEALAAMDEGLLYGVSRLVSNRLKALEATDQEAEWAWLQIMGPALDRAATERDATEAAKLREAFAKETPPTPAEAETLAGSIETLFPAP